MATSNSEKSSTVLASEAIDRAITQALKNAATPRTPDEQAFADAKTLDDAKTAMLVIALILQGIFACMAWGGIVYAWYAGVGYAVIGSAVVWAARHVMLQNAKNEIATDQRMRATARKS